MWGLPTAGAEPETGRYHGPLGHGPGPGTEPGAVAQRPLAFGHWPRSQGLLGNGRRASVAGTGVARVLHKGGPCPPCAAPTGTRRGSHVWPCPIDPEHVP